MRLTTSLIWILALCVSTTVAAAEINSPLPMGSPSAQGFSDARLARMGDFMQTIIESQDFLGAVTLIARNVRIVDWRTYGHADLARKTPMARDSIFRVYSMTKTVTSVAVLMLMEEGRLVLEDPVSKYLPEFGSIKVFIGGLADAPQ